MKFVVDHDLHIHSHLSICSNDPEQTKESILAYAKKNNYKYICLTDHYWDEKVCNFPKNHFYHTQTTSHVMESLPLPQDENVKFYFGCETDMDRLETIGIAPESYDLFDFIIVATTHLHFMGFTLTPEEDNVEARAKLWVSRFDALLNSNLPFHKVGIAHLTDTLLAPCDNEEDPYADTRTTLDLIPEEEMRRLFTKAAEVGLGIELNVWNMEPITGPEDALFRPFRIAKECGCKFYCASDSHHPENFDLMNNGQLERIIDLLGLEESDKLHIGK